MPRATSDDRQLRADARQSREQIVTAAVRCLGEDPRATTSEIARAADVGRVTLYSHYASRELLVEAALVRVLQDGDGLLDAIDLTGEVAGALAELVRTGWLLTVRAANVLTAAQACLPAERVQELHERPGQRVEALLRRGQQDGVVRRDLPVGWLASVLHHLMKGAASEVRAGRISEAEATSYLVATALAATLADASGAG